MNPRVAGVTPTENYKLELLFNNGERRVYDCSGLLEFGVFQELKDMNYFGRARVCDGTVAWPNEQDIGPDTLYLDSWVESNGKAVPADVSAAALRRQTSG